MIAGHLSDQMVKAIANLIEFCYLVRRDVIDEDTLDAVDNALNSFHENREAFRAVRPEGFSLPCQHSLLHYRRSIELFGAPNGVCTSTSISKQSRNLTIASTATNRWGKCL